MRSMENVRTHIEHMTRLLEQNRTASKTILRKLNTLSKRPQSAIKENEILKKLLTKLATKELKIQKVLEDLLVFVLKQQIIRQKNDNTARDDTTNNEED